MSRPRRPFWGAPQPRRIPKHPIRDAAILYGVLGVVLVVIALIANTSVARAIVLAVGVFVIAVGWSTLSWRRHMREVRREEFRG